MRSISVTGSPGIQPVVAQDGLSQADVGDRRGQIAVVGIGPGHAVGLTLEARQALAEADVIAGYHTYLDLVADMIVGKNVIGSGMMQEVERCASAV